jgi:ABC-2 type transport system ATP-binding protein
MPERGSDAPNRPVMRARGLTKWFGQVAAVSDLSLELSAGEALALVGPNGAGKTTTLLMLATLLPPDSGEILIMGLDARDPFSVRPLIGFMPDVLGVYPEMLVGEYLEFFARAYAIEERLIGYSIREAASFAGLENILDSPAGNLSRGMLQRVSLARAILHDPPVLLLDEPAAGLDPRSRTEFRHMILELRRKGKSIIISSHVLSDLEEISTRIAIIEEGRIRINEQMDVFVGNARGSRTFRVIAAGDGERAHGLLKERSDIGNLRWDGEALLFELHRKSDAASDVLRNLVEAGVQIEGFSEVPFSLEKAYLARTSAHE